MFHQAPRALRPAGIADFRLHGLRHTWASWHVMSRMGLRELGCDDTAAVVRCSYPDSEPDPC
jgi:integrase